MDWFTSDQHWFHDNIINYCHRPYDDIDHMHSCMILFWNTLVKPEDRVFVIGDWTFSGFEMSKKLTKSLNGEKHLIKGNHDFRRSKNWFHRIGFDHVYKRRKIHTLSNGETVELCHFDVRDENSLKNTWLLHGHRHTEKRIDYKEKTINVGVDVWKFRPVLEKEIIDIIGVENAETSHRNI